MLKKREHQLSLKQMDLAAGKGVTVAMTLDEALRKFKRYAWLMPNLVMPLRKWL